MEILTSVRRLYISCKSLVNDFVYSFGRAALLLLAEVQNHTVPVRERRRIRVKLHVFIHTLWVLSRCCVRWIFCIAQGSPQQGILTIRGLPKTPILPQLKVAVFVSCVLPSQPLIAQWLLGVTTISTINRTVVAINYQLM